AAAREALAEIGGNLEEALATEHDAALGNGGLGRLAACFLDSLASLDMPGFGYGIHYEYGLFRQEIDNCSQREQPDNWLAYGSPWEIERPGEACVAPAYGHIEHTEDAEGRYNPLWLGWRVLIGVPYDLPIVGYGGRTVNWLRLFAPRSSEDFADQVAIQLNDTHPSLTVLELMRILVDEKRRSWEEAWETVGATCGYTNHTLMPEALERWPVPLFERVLPRHLQILYEVNH